MAKNRYVDALKELVHGAGMSFVLGMSGYVIMFFFKLLTARYFGPADYGLFEIINNITGVFMLIANFGLSSGITRYLPMYKAKGHHPQMKGLIRFAFGLPLIVSIVGVSLIFVFAESITGFFGFAPIFTDMLRLMCFVLPFRVVTEVLCAIFFAHKKVFEGSFALNVLEKLIMLVGVIIIIQNHGGIYNLVMLFAIGIVVTFLFNFILYRKTTALKNVKEPVYEYKEWLTFSLPLLFFGLVMYIFAWSDNFIIGKFLGAEAVGIYGAAYSTATYLIFIPALFASILIPVLSELRVKKKAYYEKAFERVKMWGLTSSLFIGLVFLFFSRQIIMYVYGNRFADGSLTFFILTIFFIMASYFIFYNQILIVEKDTKFVFLAALVFTSFNLVLNIILMSIYQNIVVVAISTGINLFLLRLCECIRSTRYLATKFDFLYFGKALIAGLISVSVVKLLYVYVLASVQMIFVFKIGILFVIYSILFIWLFVLFKAFVKDDIDILKAVAKKIHVHLPFLKK